MIDNTSGLVRLPELHLVHLPLEMLHAWRPTCNKGISGKRTSPDNTSHLVHISPKICYTSIR
jgi:hypothetical protein